MSEGPSIVILKEEVKKFEGQKILLATGYSKIEYEKVTGQKILEFKSWGKHFLVCLKKSYLRIHLLMFGSYCINTKKEGRNPALTLKFKKGEINFYTCSVRVIEEDVNETYDWESDVLSDDWNKRKALNKLKKTKKMNVCDALLDQTIFSGVGNIIKNEVLYRIKVHPKSSVDKLPPKKLSELVREAANYSWDFYHWKKKFELKKHWLIYKKKKCTRCGIPAVKAHLGKGKRLTTYCENCQELYR